MSLLPIEFPLWLVQRLPVWWKARRVKRALKGR